MENIQESELIFDRSYTLDAIYISNGFYDLFSISEGFSDKVFAIGEIPVVTVGDYEIITTSVYEKKEFKITSNNGSDVNLTILDQLTYIYPVGIPFERVQTLDDKGIGEYSFLNNLSIISLTINDNIIVVDESIAQNNIKVLAIGI